MRRLHEQLQKRLRDPYQVISLGELPPADPILLKARADKGWKRALGRLKATLLVTREYEHLLLALEKDRTTWLQVPHPSGLAVDRKKKSVHLACTRNPNLLLELKGPILRPERARFLPGSLYLHDLAMIQGTLFGNSAGQNAVVRLDYEKGAQRVWWPHSIGRRNPVFHRNHLQLNSIAAGRSLRDSFFSASTATMLDRRPGDPLFPVDKRGVIFSGRTREPMAWGLTRPHSARLYQGDLWVCNSGYGEVGKVKAGVFHPVARLGSWTRGLCFARGILFVGISKVLPRFGAYAPGLDIKTSQCGVVALDPKTGKELGRIVWPQGNQIFAIDWLEGASLPYGRAEDVREFFYR